MFGPLGVPELLFIMALALLIFGPRKLPEIGRTLGKGMSEFRKASNELKRTLNAEVIREEIRQNDPRRILRDAMDEPAERDPPKPSAAGAKAAGPDDESADDESEDGPVGAVARSRAAADAGSSGEKSPETAAEAVSSPSS